MSGEFSHDVRLLACDNCGGPLEAPTQGGMLTCGQCNVVSQLVPRPEAPLITPPQPEEVRLQKLRAQDGKPLLPPDAVAEYLAAGGLTRGKHLEAHQYWRRLRHDLLLAHDAQAEQNIYFLTLLLGDHFSCNGEFLAARLLLESTLEVMREPRHVQVLRCWLARQAAIAGDARSSDAWLSPCDARSDDLQMDTAYRYTRAYLGNLRGDFQSVLDALGATYEAVPIADSHDQVCGLHRANAIERTQGVDKAVDEILLVAKSNTDGWLDLEDIRKAQRDLDLCASSFDVARTRVPIWRRSLSCLPIGCSVLFLLLELPLVIDAFLGPRLYGRSYTGSAGIVFALVIGFLGMLYLWFLLQSRIARARKRDERPA